MSCLEKKGFVVIVQGEAFFMHDISMSGVSQQYYDFRDSHVIMCSLKLTEASNHVLYYFQHSSLNSSF